MTICGLKVKDGLVDGSEGAGLLSTVTLVHGLHIHQKSGPGKSKYTNFAFTVLHEVLYLCSS